MFPTYNATTHLDTSLKELIPEGGITKVEFFAAIALGAILSRETISVSIVEDCQKAILYGEVLADQFAKQESVETPKET